MAGKEVLVVSVLLEEAEGKSLHVWVGGGEGRDQLVKIDVSL